MSELADMNVAVSLMIIDTQDMQAVRIFTSSALV